MTLLLILGQAQGAGGPVEPPPPDPLAITLDSYTAALGVDSETISLIAGVPTIGVYVDARY